MQNQKDELRKKKKYEFNFIKVNILFLKDTVKRMKR